MAINFNELEEALYHIRVNHLGNCDPNNCTKYERLWEETYRPAFEKIVYKI